VEAVGLRERGVDKDELKSRIMNWLSGPTKDFDEIWEILKDAGQHKFEIEYEQDGERRAIILVHGEANVRRARALLEDL
jgi:hypothetical protein